MKRTEAEPAIRTLVHQWAEAAGIAVGSAEPPSFSAFRRWAEEQGYSGYLVFRYKIVALEDFDR